MKISAIIAGIIGAIAVMGLDSSSIWPIVIACICLAYLVLVVCVEWDSWMRFWVEKGYWNYADDYIEDPWEKADVYEYRKK